MSAYPGAQPKDSDGLKIRVRHLENELRLTRQEKENASRNYLELYRRLDDLVKDETSQLLSVFVRFFVFIWQKGNSVFITFPRADVLVQSKVEFCKDLVL